jgi:hypothetical protein
MYSSIHLLLACIGNLISGPDERKELVATLAGGGHEVAESVENCTPLWRGTGTCWVHAKPARVLLSAASLLFVARR